jgi:hypothetical protein
MVKPRAARGVRLAQMTRCSQLDIPWARCRTARVLRETIQRFVLSPILT